MATRSSSSQGTRSGGGATGTTAKAGKAAGEGGRSGKASRRASDGEVQIDICVPEPPPKSDKSLRSKASLKHGTDR